MELISVLFGLFALVTFFMPWVNHVRFGSMKKDAEGLKDRIRDLEDRLNSISNAPPTKSVAMEQQAVQKQEATHPIPEPPVEPKPAPEITTAKEETAKPEPAREASPPYIPKVQKPDFIEKAQSSFEHNIATKLPVWIGSISLIFAAFFLVKYTIEYGWLGPVARVCLGVLFSGSLVGAGHFISARPHIANAKRISQGLIGAGIVGLYVSLYATINLYGLMPPMLGFAGMSIVTGAAVILSLRHGQPIAVFGLIGGLLTPALVGSEEPNAFALFTYLFLLFSGLFIVLIRQGWWALSILALLGVFGWSALWFIAAFAASDSIVLIMFAMGLAAVVLSATGKRIADDTLGDQEKTPVHCLNGAAIIGSLLTIVWLSFKIQLGLFDWSMLGLLSLALMALSYFKPAIYQTPLALKLAASLLLLLLWAGGVPTTNALAVILGMGAVYIGAAAFMMRQVSDPRFWSGLQAVAAIALYLISYWTLDLSEAMTQSFGYFWGVISLVLASLTIYQASDIRAKYNADPIIQNHLVAIYALAASAFISIGIVIEVPQAYMPLAFAVQIAATALIYQRTGTEFLKKIMYILTLIFVALNFDQISMFFGMTLNGVFGFSPGRAVFSGAVLDTPLINLGLPVCLLYLSLGICLKHDKTDQKLIHALFGAANVFALFTAYYVFREIFYGAEDNIFETASGFIERGIFTFALAATGIGILEFIRRHDIAFLKPWGVWIFRLSVIRFVYYDMLLLNPYWSDEQFVGDLPILNGVTFTYGLGFLAVMWAMRNGDLIAKTDFLKKLYGTIALAAIFAFVSLNVRQYFHGGYLVEGDMSSAEMYSYSVAWVLAGIAILSAGIKLESKAARMASVAFVGLAVFKVFLFDAAELEGLYRVFSFFGLGVSLIGLSYFYTRFVFQKTDLNDLK